MTTSKINLAELRAEILEDDQTTTERGNEFNAKVLALIDTAEAAIADLAEVRNTHWAGEWWPDRLDATLDRFTTTEPT